MSVTFLITALVIVVTPGVGALYTMTTGLAHGARAGVVAAVGCTLGIVPHLAAAITGTAALLRASAVAFEAIKFAGVAYLLYLAWATWRDRSELVIESGQPPRPALRVIASGVATNLLNPKLTMFFFAFLPQFVGRHGHGQLTTMLGLSAVFMLMTLVVFALYGLFAGALRHRIVGHPRFVRRLRQAFAVSFVGLSVKLALTARD